LKSKKLKVAVTGNIGSGKSLFCNILSEKGYPVVKADDISKTILIGNVEIKSKVIKEFGDESFVGNGINKKYVADKIFSSPLNLKKINSILHPEVIKKVKLLTKELFKKNDIVFTEAALIYEAYMEEMFDYVVLITADRKLRMQRKAESDGFSEEEFSKRESNQIPQEEKKKQADFIFENNGSVDELKEKVNLLINILKGLA
jgi:dephospho-CoA kinase